MAELQTEPHTCGYHTLSTIYIAHGLDPIEMRLRDRLGTDVPVFSLDKTTDGTVQPDMTRVLAQDQFHVEAADPGDAQGQNQIRSHLEQGFYAVALLKRRENEHLHWVTLVGVDAQRNTLEVVDSIPRGEVHTYTEPFTEFAEDFLIQVLLIRPESSSPSNGTVYRQHASGWGMMTGIFGLPLIPSMLLSIVLLGSVWTVGLFLLGIRTKPFPFWQSGVSAMVGVFAGLLTLTLTAYVLPGGFLFPFFVGWACCGVMLKLLCGTSWADAAFRSIVSFLVMAFCLCFLLLGVLLLVL